MDILDELESIACAVGGESDTFKRVSGIVDKLLSALKSAEMERDELRAVLAKAGERLAIDENANERGEPDAIYLQLHDPASFDDTEKDDFRADGVTWCWHKINHNDVRYIRADLANPQPAQAAAIPEGYEISEIDHPSRSGYVIRTKGGSYCVWSDQEPSVYKFLAALSASPKP